MRALAIAVLLMFVPLSVHAQNAGFVGPLEDAAESTCAGRGYYRQYENLSGDPYVLLFGGDPLFVTTASFQFPDASNAESFVDRVDNSVQASMSANGQINEVTSLRRISFDNFGDRTAASRFLIKNDDMEPLDELVVEIIAVQKRNDVIVVVSYSSTGATTMLVNLLHRYDLRWPNPDQGISRSESGDLVGGITDGTPRLSDFPVGWSLESSGTIMLTTCD